MAQRPEYIQLEPNDDIAHIRDRLSFIRGRRVLLIWPEEGTALTRKLDLVLVQREAKRRAIQIALITHDKTVIKNAEDLGISTYETIGSSENARWKRGRTRVFTQRHHKPEDDPSPQELIEVASRVRNPRREKSRGRYIVERLIVLGILIGVVGLLVYTIVPSATITITVAQERLTSQTTISADRTISEVDVEQSLIPAVVVQAEVQASGTIQTSGISALGDKPAIGIVTFTNTTLDRVDIPVNTIVSTSAGTPIRFKTISEVSVRGGTNQQVEVAIEALPETSGDQSNLDVGLINLVEGDLSTSVTVINLSPTTGGETRSFASVTAEDQERLASIVRGQLQASAYDEMQASLTGTQIIVIETIHIAEERSDWIQYSYQVGDITDTLSLTMKAIVEAIVIDDRYSKQIVFAKLSGLRPSGKILQAESFNYQRGAVTEITDNRVMFSASGDVLATSQVDAQSLIPQIVGQPIDNARQIIQRITNSPTPPEITVEPNWFNQVPILPLRIQIVVKNS